MNIRDTVNTIHDNIVGSDKGLDQQIVSSYTKMIKMYYKCMKTGEFAKAVQVLNAMKAGIEVQILATQGLVKMNEEMRNVAKIVDSTTSNISSDKGTPT